MIGQVDDGEVEVVAEELGDERRGGGVDHDHVDLRDASSRDALRARSGTSQRPMVPMQPRRTSPVTSSRRAATSAAMASSSRLDVAGPVDHDLALLGERAGGPVDEGDAQLALEAGDVGRDVRLHGVQGPGGGREAAVVGDGDEGGELSEVHRCNMMAPIGNNCLTDC